MFPAKTAKVITMSAVVEARRHVAGLMRPGERLQQALPRIASRIGVTARRARALWSGEAVIKAEELDALRTERARVAEHAIRTETMNHARTLEEQAARLAIIDADFHQREIDRLRHLARRARHLASGESL